jgi:hypothetical protein
MPTNAQSRSRKSRSWFRRENRRALVICLLFAGAATAGLGTAIQHNPFAGIRIAANGPGYGHAGDKLATGSIIFVPILGNTCRKKLIDNATWRIRDGGVVDCRAALTQDAHGGPSGWSGSRVDIIRHGFYRR